jgi:hypothetical protein
MKNTIVRTLFTLGLSAVLSPVALLAQDRITAEIPFDFNIGAKTFSAGEYAVKRVNEHTLMIQSIKDGTGVYASVLPADATKNGGSPVLLFNRYGDSYFLSKVSGDDRGWKLYASPREKELVGKVTSPKPVVVVASLRSK